MPHSVSRRALCGFGLSSAFTYALAAEPLRDTTYLDDFDELWRTIKDRYCYFEEKATDWNLVRSHYRAQAITANSPESFSEIARLTLAELYDAHTHLSSPAEGTPYWPPYDLLVKPVAGGAEVIAVYEGSAAEDAGIHSGDLITQVNGLQIKLATEQNMPKCLMRKDPAAEHYALNVAVGGVRGKPRQIINDGQNGPVVCNLPEKTYPHLPDLEAKLLRGNYGLVVIRSFGNSDLILQFDKALERLADLPGLIIDVRYNGGGDTAVARPIMGRFISERRPYALMRRRKGQGLSAPWTEYVEPRGPFTYKKPVIVMCGHWSASMAEGFPMGMRDIGCAKVVGTQMMGLGAAVYDCTLDRTGTRVQYSAEPVYATNGVVRSRFMPDVIVAPGKSIIDAAVLEMDKMVHGR